MSCTTHCSPQADVKSTLVHEVPHHWEITTVNCIVKACLTTLIHLKHPLSKEGQQVLHTLKRSTTGNPVEGSGWTLCAWLLSRVKCCIRLWVHTDECDSLVPCETHLPHVPPTSSVQGGGSSMQHTSLVSLTTGENNQMVFTQWYRNSHAASFNTHSHHSLTLHITLFTTTLVCATGCGVDQRQQCATRQTLGVALFVASSRDTSADKIKHSPNTPRTLSLITLILWSPWKTLTLKVSTVLEIM